MWTLLLPVLKKFGGAIFIVAATASVVFAIYHAGLHAGQHDEAGKETEAAKAQFSQVADTYKEALTTAQAAATHNADLALQYAQLAIAASQRVTQAQTVVKESQQKVAAIPDAGIKADLELKLGGPLENPAVLRKDDEIVSAAPGKDVVIKAQADKLDAINKELNAVSQQMTAVAAERDSAMDAYAHLVPIYAQAYNAAIVPHRKWYCAFLCSKKSTLKLPDPVTLASVVNKKGG